MKKYYIYANNSKESELYRRKLKAIAMLRDGTLTDVNGVRKKIEDISDDDLIKSKYKCYGYVNGKINRDVDTTEQMMAECKNGEWVAKSLGIITLNPLYNGEELIRGAIEVNTDILFEGSGYIRVENQMPDLKEI